MGVELMQGIPKEESALGDSPRDGVGVVSLRATRSGSRVLRRDRIVLRRLVASRRNLSGASDSEAEALETDTLAIESALDDRPLRLK